MKARGAALCNRGLSGAGMARKAEAVPEEVITGLRTEKRGVNKAKGWEKERFRQEGWHMKKLHDKWSMAHGEIKRSYLLAGAQQARDSARDATTAVERSACVHGETAPPWHPSNCTSPRRKGSVIYRMPPDLPQDMSREAVLWGTVRGRSSSASLAGRRLPVLQKAAARQSLIRLLVPVRRRTLPLTFFRYSCRL